MPPRSRPTPTIADLVTLAAAFERDERLDRETRARCDEAVAAQLAAAEKNDAVPALVWLRRTCAEEAELRTLHERIAAATHAASFVVALLGVLVGWGTALGVFY